jgi:FtsZ-binding cell division protein ZapB
MDDKDCALTQNEIDELVNSRESLFGSSFRDTQENLIQRVNYLQQDVNELKSRIHQLETLVAKGFDLED